MNPTDSRVTARIMQTTDGTTYKEYRAGGRVFRSLEALKEATRRREQ